AWLDSSSRRRAADQGRLQAVRMAEAIPAEPDRHTGRLSPKGIDPGHRPSPAGDRRLRCLDARFLNESALSRHFLPHFAFSWLPRPQRPLAFRINAGATFGV